MSPPPPLDSDLGRFLACFAPRPSQFKAFCAQRGATPPAVPQFLPQRRAAGAAPFRALCQSWAMDPAIVAHRYALTMRGVSTVVLGVKNRQELMACLDGGGPLSMEQIALIDALGLQRP